MHKSLGPFLSALWKVWWALIPGILGTVIGGVQSIEGGTDFHLPAWSAWAVGGVGLFVAAFLAFHNEKKAKDAALSLIGKRAEFEKTIREIVQRLRDISIDEHLDTTTKRETARRAIEVEQRTAIRTLRVAQVNGILDPGLPLASDGPSLTDEPKTWVKLFQFSQDWPDVPHIADMADMKADDKGLRLVFDLESVPMGQWRRHAIALIEATARRYSGSNQP